MTIGLLTLRPNRVLPKTFHYVCDENDITSGADCWMPHPHFIKKVNIDALAAEVNAALGIDLMVHDWDGTAHGHVSAVSKDAGEPFAFVTGDFRYTEDDGTKHVEPWRVEADQCGMCETIVPREEPHDCAEVILYTSHGLGHKRPRAYRHIPRTTLIPHGLDATGIARLKEVVDAHVAPLPSRRPLSLKR